MYFKLSIKELNDVIVVSVIKSNTIDIPKIESFSIIKLVLFIGVREPFFLYSILIKVFKTIFEEILSNKNCSGLIKLKSDEIFISFAKYFFDS